MLDKYLQVEGLSIVILGDFNPAILHPQWLAGKNLIRENEANSASIGVVHNEISSFDLDWCTIEFTKTKAVIKTQKKPYFDLIKDLLIGIFAYLPETPIRSFGLNYTFDISLKTAKLNYDFGNFITPLNFWGEFLNDPRLFQIELLEDNLASDGKSYRRVRISSASKESLPFGIEILVNNHFELENKKGAQKFNKVLKEKFFETGNESKTIATSVFNRILSNVIE